MQVGRVRLRPVDALAVGTVAVLLVGAHVVVPAPSTRYGAYLLAFAVWMAWFVERVAGMLRQRRA